jgi:hypothetical protein
MTSAKVTPDVLQIDAGGLSIETALPAASVRFGTIVIVGDVSPIETYQITLTAAGVHQWTPVSGAPNPVSDFFVYLSPTGSDSNSGRSASQPLRSKEAALRKFEALPPPRPGDRWRIIAAAGTYDVSSGFEVFLPNYSFCPIVMVCPLTTLRSGTATTVSSTVVGGVTYVYAFRSTAIAATSIDQFQYKTVTWITAADGERHRVKIQTNTLAPQEIQLIDYIPNAAAGDSWTIDEPGCIYPYSGPVSLRGQTSSPDGNSNINLLCFGCRDVGTTAAYKYEVSGGLAVGCWLCEVELGGGQFYVHDGGKVICTNFSTLVPDLIKPLEGLCGALISSTGPTSGPFGTSVLIEDLGTISGTCCWRAVGPTNVRNDSYFLPENLQMRDCGEVHATLDGQASAIGVGVGTILSGGVLKRTQMVFSSGAFPAVPGRTGFRASSGGRVLVIGDLSITGREGAAIDLGPACLLDLKTLSQQYTGGVTTTLLTGAGNAFGVAVDALAYIDGVPAEEALNTMTGAADINGSTGNTTWAAVAAGGGLIVGDPAPVI